MKNLVPSRLLKTLQVDNLTDRVSWRNLAQIDEFAFDPLDQRPGVLFAPVHPSSLGMDRGRVRMDGNLLGQADRTTLIQKRPTKGNVVSPHSAQGNVTLIDKGLFDGEAFLFPAQAQRFL